MSKTKPGHVSWVGITALVAVFAFSAIDPAVAAERRSIRWATSSVDSYGYKVAASMVKIVEDALGGQYQYTVTVNPYPSTTGAMKATMDGDGEIGYTADVGMTELYEGTGGFKGYTLPRQSWSTPGTPTPWSRSWPPLPRTLSSTSPGATSAGSPYSSPCRLHELDELHAHL